MAVTPAPFALPYRFDTSNVWHSILKLAFGLNALLIVLIGVCALMRPWSVTLALVIIELMAAGFTRVLFRFQEGSAGTLYTDRVDVDPNVLLRLPLPGPRGSYSMDRFASIRVEFRSGPIEPGVQGGPNEVIWLVGRAGTPNIAIARTDDRAGRAIGGQIAALLNLPVE